MVALLEHPLQQVRFILTICLPFWIKGIAIRSGHRCTQPLHRILDIFSRARASLYFYNTREEIDTFLVVLKAAIAFFG
jgi:selenocysteine lyase/cysteine desulfurase